MKPAIRKTEQPSLTSASVPLTLVPRPLISFRPYQKPIFMDRTTGTLVLHWSRQIGKSFTLAAWAVDRLLTRPGRLVTVLSNSRDNGAEFVAKCQEVCLLLGQALEIEDQSTDLNYENMRFEVRITVNGKTGRIKVLAANPRTARGFSGDLILDEFAFHENSNLIWEAAEPILSSNPDFICRIASTGNGKFNMFYRMATGTVFPVNRVTRTDAYRQGIQIYDPVTRKAITPDEARAMALDKRAYDQNYECAFADENMTLLTHELISAAERPFENADGVLQYVVCNQVWSGAAQDLFLGCKGDLYLGQDVGRQHDLSVQAVVEKLGNERFVRGILRMSGMRLPDQQQQLGFVCRMPKFHKACLDMTGIGLGLVEYAQDAFGYGRVQGINFSTTVPLTKRIAQEGRKQETVKITEAMAVELLQVYEDHLIRHPADPALRDDLRKPERVVSPGGRVSIAATRDEAGHADHFWAFALAEHALGNAAAPLACTGISSAKNRMGSIPHIARRKAVLV